LPGEATGLLKRGNELIPKEWSLNLEKEFNKADLKAGMQEKVEGRATPWKV
jgi:hypothetical protein